MHYQQQRLRVMRALFALGGLLLIAAPSTASAHDNLGGDELAASNWMLICALVVLVMGVLAAVWAARAGQFSNVEESKYTMLDTAEDYDAIMAAAPDPARKRKTRSAAQSADLRGPKAATAAERPAHVEL